MNELGMSHVFPQSNCGRWLPKYLRNQQGPLLREPGENFVTDSDLEFCSASGIIIPYNSKDYLKTSSFGLSITQIPANLGGEGWQSVNWSGSSINTFCIYLTYKCSVVICYQ